MDNIWLWKISLMIIQTKCYDFVQYVNLLFKIKRVIVYNRKSVNSSYTKQMGFACAVLSKQEGTVQVWRAILAALFTHSLRLCRPRSPHWRTFEPVYAGGQHQKAAAGGNFFMLSPAQKTYFDIILAHNFAGEMEATMFLCYQ